MSLIYNATIYPMDDEKKPEKHFLGWIAFENGKITSLGEGTPDVSLEGALDAQGGVLCPGLIDAHSHLGMIGDGLGFESDDVNEESDPVTPHLRAIDAINPFDRGFIDARRAGITTVVTGPGSANAIGGEMAAVKTSGKRVEEMLLRAPIAMKFALGENPKVTYHQKDSGPETRMASAALIREALFKARRYAQDIEKAAEDEDNSPPDFDAKCEALLPVLNGSIQAHFHAHRADDICTALRIAKEFSLDARIVHATEASRVAEILKSENAKVFLGPFFLAHSKPEVVNESAATPAVLFETGVPFSLMTDHPENPSQFLLLSACLAVKNGLPRAQALAALTSEPARILGLYDRIGSLEPEKDADMVLYSSDPFDFYSEVSAVFLNGVRVDM